MYGQKKEKPLTAFPVPGYAEESGAIWYNSEGMSLRDYFAAHCPSDLAVIRVFEDRVKIVGREYPAEGILEQLAWNMELEAKLRYAYADAMLAEKQEGKWSGK